MFSSQRFGFVAAASALVLAAGSTFAQVGIVTLNPGGPQATSENGLTVYGGNTRYELSSGISLVTLPGTSPFVSFASDDGMLASGTSNNVPAVYSKATNAWTTIPVPAGVTSLTSPRGASANGQWVVGQTSTASNVFAGYVYSVASNTTTRLIGNTATARAIAVSNDGAVIVGGESPNVAGTTSGGRLGVWRFNTTTSMYDWSYLPDGPADAANTPVYRTVDLFKINAAGTLVVGDSFQWDPVDQRVERYLTKWTWETSTSTWSRNNFYNITEAPPSISSWWTALVPFGPNFNISSVSDDGNTIVGQLVYSTGGSFYRAGFIYANNTMNDLWDYLNGLNVNLTATGYGTFNNSGFQGTHLGYATDISNNGMILVGQPILDPDSPGGWKVDLNSGAGCVTPAVAGQPTATNNFSACSSLVSLNVGVAGSGPFTYQWQKNGVNIFAGPTGNGTSTYQLLGGDRNLRINGPFTPADAGNYTCIVSSQCGSATSNVAVVQVDPAFASQTVTNDICATDVREVMMGTNVLGAGDSPCAAWVTDTSSGVSCVTAVKADRWYKFVAPSSQTYRLETCGSNFDTVLSIFNGCGGTELECNNDYVTGPSTGCSSNRSRIGSIALTGGTTYYIRIAAPSTAFLSSTNLMNLSITASPPIPANDSCVNATPAALGITPFNTTEAISSFGLSALTCAASSNGSRDVWFTYTAPRGGTLTASTCPQGTAPVGYSLMNNTVLSFHDTPCGGEVACSDNHTPVPSGCGSQLSTISGYAINAGATVWIRVAGNSSSTFGAGQLSLSFTPTCPCVADFDNGTGTGVCDGGVGIEDLLYYLSVYDAGTIVADVDNGSGTGTPDGGVGIEDLLYYLQRYDSGC